MVATIICVQRSNEISHDRIQLCHLKGLDTYSWFEKFGCTYSATVNGLINVFSRESRTLQSADMFVAMFIKKRNIRL